MSVSLDGFVETPNRTIDWVIVDEELHTFFNDQARETGAFLYGRLMAGWQPKYDRPHLSFVLMMNIPRISV